MNSGRPSATTMTVTAKMLGSETAAACRCYHGGESASTKEQTSKDKENRRGAKIISTPRRVRMRSSIVCFQPTTLPKALRRVQGHNTLSKLFVGCRAYGLFPLSLAQPDVTMEIS